MRLSDTLREALVQAAGQLLAGLLVLFAAAPALASESAVTPVIEVAAFGVQPADPKAAISHNRVYASLIGQPASTRVFHQDSWAQILRRLKVAPDTAPDKAFLGQLPELVPAKYVRLRDASGHSQRRSSTMC